jgi:hypothetical protein
VTLNDPLFYLELAGHCLNEAYRCDSVTAAMGLRTLAQSYLDTADALQTKAAPQALRLQLVPQAA